MKHLSMKKLLMVAMTTICVASGQAHADDDSEREKLARIAYEIERVEQMISDAGAEAVTATRIRFQYDWLMRDLQLVRDGINAHLDSPRQPRPVPPLKGDYRR
jgi:RAQPRD family integrative conjugative element protein